ncbi:MAG TPA: hypothetical protein VFP72_00950 [Kineosporiaceae bacterium]|nr:hypothetical protein [Kineosporiaceae bacterium]
MTLTVGARPQGKHLQEPGEGRLQVRVVGSGTPPVLALRQGAPCGQPADPLYGNEIWHAVTPTMMLAGLRDTVTAEQFLDCLGYGRLTALRAAMAAAGPGLTRRDRTFGTVSALSTLLCWPAQARLQLTTAAGEAAVQALQRRRVMSRVETTLAMRWVVTLSRTFPGDPMVLAPLLLTLRWFDRGEEFVLPAGWPSAVLSGDAVNVSGLGSCVVDAGLAAREPNPDAFVAALDRHAGEPRREPAADALDRALGLARTLASRPAGRPA